VAQLVWNARRFGTHRPRRAAFTGGCTWGCAATLLLLAVLLAPGGEAPPFIYFQF